MLDGIALGETIASMCIAIDERATVARFAEGWVVLGCRYVRKSPALLAFNRFDIGMMISIDGVDSKTSRAYFAAAADRLEALGIDYTQHWGKVNGYTPARVKKAYGANVDKWLAARKALLPVKADRTRFDNQYIEERGLAG